MSAAEQDLDIAIGHFAELLASNLHAQRAAHFPPDAKKVMRSLSSGEAAELLGVDHTYLRKLHREGKISDVETTAGSHRRYTLDDIWEIRHSLEANAKKPGTYVPGRRSGDELQVVSVVNFKGGSGKTTTSAHLAQRLAFKGYRVLAIDLDPQASMSALHGIQPELDLMEGGTLYDAVRYDDPVPISEVIRKTYIRGLDLIPGNLELMEFEHETPAAIQRGGARAFFARVRDALDSVESDYDVVVIDCPPALGLLTVNALVASSHLLIPIQSSYFALEGTDDLLETIEKVRSRANPNLRILGVVITMHDRRTALARDIRSQIDKVFGNKVFRTVITKSVRLEESPAYKESIFKFAPESSGATEYYRLCEEVMDRV